MLACEQLHACSHCSFCFAAHDVLTVCNVLVHRHAGLLLLAAYAPFGILHFAIQGHKVWLATSGTGDSRCSAPAAESTSAALAAASGDAPKALRSRASLGKVPAGWQNANNSLKEQHGQNTPHAHQHSRWFYLSAVEPIVVPDSGSSSGAASPAVQQRRGSFQRQGSIVQSAPPQRGMLYAVKRLLCQTCTILCAAAIGTAAYVTLLAALVLALSWAFATRTVFSVYCIFFEQAAGSNCCLRLARQADFWGLADVQAAFAAAKLSPTHAHQQQASDVLATAHTEDASCSVAVAQAVQPLQAPKSAMTSATIDSLASSSLASGLFNRSSLPCG